MAIEDRPCMVCSAPNNATHFGVDVCRPCAAFFKRAKLSGRQYPCRQGKRDCEVARDDKFTCRRCRFDKCVAVGMVYDGPLRKAKKDNAEKEMFQELPSISSPVSLIERIGREYEVNVANRQTRELELLRIPGNGTRIPHPTAEIYSSTADVIERTMLFSIEESWSTFNKMFPTLNDLQLHEKMDLCRFYIPPFFLIDSYLRTLKIWGVHDQFSMCSVSVCVEIYSPETWLRPEDGGCRRSALVDSMVNYVQLQMSTLLPSLVKAQITEQEVYALFALMLCETDMKVDSSELLLSLLDAIRDETLLDLQRYYREEMRLHDYSTRLGNLMTICHAVRECTSNFRSFFLMQVTLFDLWTAETQLKELLL